MPSPADDRRSQSQIFAAFMAQGLWAAGVIAALSVVQKDLGVSESRWGLVLGVAWATSMPIRLAAGSLIARFGRPLLPLAYATASLALLTTAIAPNELLMFLAFCLYSASNGIVVASANAAGVHFEHRTRKTVMSNLHAGWALGAAVATLAFGAFIGAGASAASIFAGLSVIALTCAFALRNLIADLGDDTPDSRITIIDRNLLAIPGVKLASTMGLFFALAETGMLLWTIIYVRDEFGLAGVGSTSGIAAFLAAMALGRFAFNPIVNRLGRIRSLECAGWFIAVAMTAGLITNSPVVACVAFLVVGLGCAIAVPISISLIGSLAIGRAASAGSFGMAVISLAGVLSPMAIGVLAGLTNLRIGLGLIAACGAISALLARRFQVVQQRTVDLTEQTAPV